MPLLSGESFKAIFAKAAEATESDEILFVPFPDPRRKPFNMVNIQNPYPDFRGQCNSSDNEAEFALSADVEGPVGGELVIVQGRGRS